MKKFLGYSLAVLLAIAAGLYVALFFNPQTPEQGEINAAWVRFGEDVAALDEVVQGAPFNRDEQTAAEGYRHVARLLATFLAYHTDLADPTIRSSCASPTPWRASAGTTPTTPISPSCPGRPRVSAAGNVDAFDMVTINVYSGCWATRRFRKSATYRASPRKI